MPVAIVEGEYAYDAGEGGRGLFQSVNEPSEAHDGW